MQPCYEWRILKLDTIKTWNNFQIHFILAWKDRKNMSTTTRDVGFPNVTHTAPILFDDTTVGTYNNTYTNISAFIETIIGKH